MKMLADNARGDENKKKTLALELSFYKWFAC